MTPPRPSRPTRSIAYLPMTRHDIAVAPSTKPIWLYPRVEVPRRRRSKPLIQACTRKPVLGSSAPDPDSRRPTHTIGSC